MKQRVLFVGIHNAARSQMAEAFLNAAFPGRFEAHSAGLVPAPLNRLAVQAMRELGFDISQKKPKPVFDFIHAGEHFDYIITVCDDAGGDRCPVFPGVNARLHWGFADPSAYQGSCEEKLAFMRHVRDEIKDQITLWCAEQRGHTVVAS
jgi:arsenate reductase (thioredoxin)